MATAQVVRTDVSGTSFVLDVTALELNVSLSTIDYEVTHNGAVVTPSYAKTSVSQLTYTGTSVTLGTRIIARRTTSITQAETTFISTTTASALTNALEKERLRLDELDNRISYVLNQLVAGGITLGTIPISSTAFGAAWNNDNSNTASRAALFTKFTANDTSITNLGTTKADIASPTLTGDPKAPTPAVTDNDTSIATTGYVVARASSRLVFINTNTGAISPSTSSFTNFTSLTGNLRSGFSDSYSSGVLTVGVAGTYLVLITLQFTGSTANITDALITINVGTGDSIYARVNAPAAVQYSVQTAVRTVVLTAGATITPKAYVTFASGSVSVTCETFTVVQL